MRFQRLIGKPDAGPRITQLSAAFGLPHRHPIIHRAIYAAVQDIAFQTARRLVVRGVSEPHLGQPLRLLRKCGQSAVREELFPLVPVVRDTVRQHPDIQEGADTAAAVIDVLCHMCDVVEIEQLVRHFHPVCPAAVRNCGIPHCRQHLRRLIDPVILNEVPVQLDMLSVWGIDLDVMVRDLPEPV